MFLYNLINEAESNLSLKELNFTLKNEIHIREWGITKLYAKFAKNTFLVEMEIFHDSLKNNVTLFEYIIFTWNIFIVS